MSKQSQILGALQVGLVALCAMAVYEITKQICFPRLSLVASHIVAIFFVGCVGFCITFIIRQREKAAEQKLLRLAALVEHSDDAIISTELDGTVTSWNRGAERMYGYSAVEAVGRHISFCHPPEKHAEFHAILQRIANGKTLERFDTQRLTKNGTIIDVSLSVSAIIDGSGRLVGTSGIARDVTARRRTEKQVQFLAYYDALTGLPNRTLLKDRLSKALASARRRKDKVALLFLDLDGFKDINDSLGHSVGDLVLKEVAERLKKWAREQDTVARLGGDEFLIVLTDVKDIPGAAVAAERLMDTMSAEFVVQGHSLGIRGSLGISIFPEHGADGEALIKNADAAMYRAKDYGRNNFQFFTEDMNAEVVSD